MSKAAHVPKIEQNVSTSLVEAPAVSRPILLPRPSGSRSEIPHRLFRRFTSKEDAENFVQFGDIRFRSILHYQSIEADLTRRDPKEGCVESNLAKAKISIRNPKTSEWSEPLEIISGTARKNLVYPQMHFVSCYSYRQHQDQRKYGDWLVTIRARDWLQYIEENSDDSESLFWGHVRYYNAEKPVHFIKAKQLWLSKPRTLKTDYEFRLLFLLGRISADEAMSLPARMHVGDCSKYMVIKHSA